jgi:hypothetical protein
MIEPLPDFPDSVIAFACRGHVTREDYEATLIPAVEAALERHDKLRLYYEIGADFSGIDPAAVWEDFKVGVEHWLRWERIAVVTDVEWIGQTMRVFSFLFPGEMRVFPTADAAQARRWIVAE